MADGLALPGLSDDEDPPPRRFAASPSMDDDDPAGYQPWRSAHERANPGVAADLGFSREDLESSDPFGLEPMDHTASELGPMQVDLTKRRGGRRLGRPRPDADPQSSPSGFEPAPMGRSVSESFGAPPETDSFGGPLQVDLLAKPKRKLGFGRRSSDGALGALASNPPSLSGTGSLQATGNFQATGSQATASPQALLRVTSEPPPDNTPLGGSPGPMLRGSQVAAIASSVPSGAAPWGSFGGASARSSVGAALGGSPGAALGGTLGPAVGTSPSGELGVSFGGVQGASPGAGSTAPAASGTRTPLQQDEEEQLTRGLRTRPTSLLSPVAPAPYLDTGARHSSRDAQVTPRSEPPLSFPPVETLSGGGRGCCAPSSCPPLTMAPSTDLLTKLAYSEAKVHHLELQLTENEERWAQRLADCKQQAQAEHERMELQCRRLEAELDRQKELRGIDLQQANETKTARVQQLEKMMSDNDERSVRRLDESRKQNEQLELQVRRLEAELERAKELHESVLRHVSEAKQADKSVEWSVRERQLEIRERSIAEREAHVSKQVKEVEEQWQRVTEMNRHMEESQNDSQQTNVRERDRLQAEHTRLLELQRTIREAERNNKEQTKHAWAQLEDERRTFTQDRLQVDAELKARREEVELQERQVRSESERLKALHLQVENARQNAARRIRETEAIVSSERRCLLHDLEVFEEKQRIFAAELSKFEAEKQQYDGERLTFEQDVQDVGRMAAEVQRRSEEMKDLHVQVAEAHAELRRLRSQVQEERAEHGSELDKLRTMQTVIEQQRLQLLQTENEIRLRGIEDVDLLFSTQALTCEKTTAALALF